MLHWFTRTFRSRSVPARACDGGTSRAHRASMHFLDYRRI